MGLRVHVLLQPDFTPPVHATIQQAEWALWKTEFYVIQALKKLGHQVSVQKACESLEEVKKELDQVRPHIVFNLMEEFDGRASFEAHIPSLLEMMGIAYTGCNPQGLSLCRDKSLSKKILQYHQIPTPGFFVVPIGSKAQKPQPLNYPLIIKSTTEEASLGISQESVVFNENKLKSRVDFIHNSLNTDALVEEYIEGRELYVGVLGHKKLTVLPPWELNFGQLAQKGRPIATRQVKFSEDYCQKHGVTRGPAQALSPFVIKQLNHLSRDIYRALKMSGYGRLDFRLTPGGQLYFLEANPNAELAKGECLANAAKLHGLSYEELIGKILSLGQSYRPAA
jgi:D-alanine-D-alanine ligase